MTVRPFAVLLKRCSKRQVAKYSLLKMALKRCLSLVASIPDILFIDIMMPRLDGYQTCSLVKSNPKFSDIPIVMLSSKDGLFDRAKGRVVGAEQYLTKPFTREDLLGAIRTHILNKKPDPAPLKLDIE